MQFLNSFLTCPCPCTHARPEAPAAPGKGSGTTRPGWRSGAKVEDRGTTPGLSGRSHSWGGGRQGRVGSSCSTRRGQAGVSAGFTQWLNGVRQSLVTRLRKSEGARDCGLEVWGFGLQFLHPSKTQFLRLRFTWSELHFHHLHFVSKLCQAYAWLGWGSGRGGERNGVTWLVQKDTKVWVLGFKHAPQSIPRQDYSRCGQTMSGKSIEKYYIYNIDIAI